jgi:G:T-mismatch repair DNA endonuclease (very short patch repair protein)
MPKGNSAYWNRKILMNRSRDRMVNRFLQKKGWRVIRIWEHEIKAHPSACVRRIAAALGKTF